MILLYIDPGSGSILVQAIVVFFATIIVFFKNIKHFILNYFRKNNSEDKDSIDQ